MTNHERLTEQYEDALFALLMYSVAEEEGKQALELNERLKADPAAEVPESARRRCEATIRREFNRKRAKKLGKVTWKIRASGLCCRYADGGAADDRNGGIGTVSAGCA